MLNLDKVQKKSKIAYLDIHKLRYQTALFEHKVQENESK